MLKSLSRLFLLSLNLIREDGSREPEAGRYFFTVQFSSKKKESFGVAVTFKKQARHIYKD
jgi:hypothetical protein